MSFLQFYKSLYPNLQSTQSGSVNVYSSTEDELYALQKGVVIRDLFDAALIRLDGDETFDFLHRISTNGISNIRENEKVNTLFTNEKGRIIDRTTFFRYKGYGILLGSKEHSELLELWLNKFIIMEDINVQNLKDTHSAIEIMGPQADSFLTIICGKAVDLLDDTRFLMLNVEKTNISIAKIRLHDNAHKFVIILPNEDYERMVDYMLKQNTIFDVKMLGEKIYNYYRIKECIPNSPNELSDMFNPHEAGLIDEVSFNKGCYIGQEVIARLDTYDKVQKKLCVIECSENGFELPEELTGDDGRDAGYVTSVAENPVKGNFIGLAYVRSKYMEVGKELNTSDTKIKIKILEIPDK